MPKRNFDDESSLFEPIEIVIEGRKYRIIKLTPEMMSEAVKVANESDNPYTSLVNQFCALTGEKPEVVRQFDVRKLSSALAFISDSFLNSTIGKKKQPNMAE